MPINFDLGKYKNKYFIETGTYMGEGIHKALECDGFKYIYSIEIDTLRHLTCKELFSTYDNITMIKGDSGELLKLVLKHITEPCTFWLDAHFCNDECEYGNKWSPIIEELNAIKEHHIKNHTIIVDDYRCMDNMHFDKERNIPIGFPGKKKLLEILKSINPDYSITFINGAIPNDVVVARVDYEIMCKDTLYNIINKIEYQELLDIESEKLANDVIKKGVYELEHESEIISKMILDNIIINVEKISKESREERLQRREIDIEKKEEYLNNKERMLIRNVPIDMTDLRIIENKLHKLDEELIKKEERLLLFETKLKNKEEQLTIKEETLLEIVIDMELQKEVRKYEILEKKNSTRKQRKAKRKRNTKL